MVFLGSFVKVVAAGNVVAKDVVGTAAAPDLRHCPPARRPGEEKLGTEAARYSKLFWTAELQS